MLSLIERAVEEINSKDRKNGLIYTNRSHEDHTKSKLILTENVGSDSYGRSLGNGVRCSNDATNILAGPKWLLLGLSSVDDSESESVYSIITLSFERL